MLLFENDIKRLETLNRFILKEKSLMSDADMLDFIQNFNDEPDFLGDMRYKECRFKIYDIYNNDQSLEFYKVTLDISRVDVLDENKPFDGYKQTDLEVCFAYASDVIRFVAFAIELIITLSDVKDAIELIQFFQSMHGTK